MLQQMYNFNTISYDIVSYTAETIALLSKILVPRKRFFEAF